MCPDRLNHPWTPEEIEKLRRFAEQGLSAKVAAIRLGRTRPAIQSAAKKHNIVFTASPYTGDCDPAT